MLRQQADSDSLPKSLAEPRGGALGWQLSQRVAGPRDRAK
jgi:hypothetical protein